MQQVLKLHETTSLHKPFHLLSQKSPGFESSIRACQDELQRHRACHTKKFSKQKDVQEVLDIGQAEVSKLLNARFHRFSEGRLMSFLNKLDQKVTVKVSPRRRGEKPQEVVFA